MSNFRPTRTGTAAVVTQAAALLVPLLFAISNPVSAGSTGKALYQDYCAACHGADARGNGPVAARLSVPPADLTRLDRRYGIPLDRDRIVSYIDGRIDVLAHGTRDMPVWGKRFQQELIGQPVTEDTMSRTIEAIVNYLMSIQQLVGAAR